MPVALGGKKSKMSTGAIAGIAVAGGVLVIALIFMSLFALRQKRRAKELKERADPFGKDLKAHRYHATAMPPSNLSGTH